MKITLPFLTLALAVANYGLRAQAPCSITITGAKCIGGTLTATPGSGSGTLAKLIWKNDTTQVYAADTVGSPASIKLIAAGANHGSLLYLGIAVDDSDNVYIANRANNSVEKWAPGAAKGVVVAGGNGTGHLAKQLDAPAALFVDAHGNVYVADSRNNRVQKWAPGATTGITVAGGNGGGGDANQLIDPRGIWVVNDTVYVADWLNYRVQKWPPGAKNGITVAGGNGRGPASNQLYDPTGICLDKAGNMYIAEAGFTPLDSQAVKKWARGADTGTVIIGGNGIGSGANHLAELEEITIDAAGNIYTSEYGVQPYPNVTGRVQKWLPGATSGITVVNGGGSGFHPLAIRVSRNGDIYNLNYDLNSVTHQVDSSRIQKFTPTNGIVNNQYSSSSPGAYTVSATFKSGCTVTSAVKQMLSAPSNLNPQPATPGGRANLCGGGIRDTFLVQGDTGTTYKWKVPTGMVVIANRNDSIIANVHADFTHGFVTVAGTNTCGTGATDSLHVVSGPLQPGGITGPKNVTAHQTNLAYHVKNLGFTYTWKVPAGATIVSGQGSASVIVNWGANSSNISVTAANDCGASVKRKQAITVTGGLMADNENVDDEASKTNMQNNSGYIYPNPAVSTATVMFTSDKQTKYMIEVQDVTGKTLLHKEAIFTVGANRIDIDVSRYAKGMYVITVAGASQQKTSFKLVKQ